MKEKYFCFFSALGSSSLWYNTSKLCFSLPMTLIGFQGKVFNTLSNCCLSENTVCVGAESSGGYEEYFVGLYLELEL